MGEILNKDYFLCDPHNSEAILNNARLAIFQIYCRTHQSVDIATIAEKMGLDPLACEGYIVQLIQSGKLQGACIDTPDCETETPTVFFPRQKTNSCAQILEKTKNMSFRLFLLQANAMGVNKKDSRKLGSLSQEAAKYLN